MKEKIIKISKSKRKGKKYMALVKNNTTKKKTKNSFWSIRLRTV